MKDTSNCDRPEKEVFDKLRAAHIFAKLDPIWDLEMLDGEDVEFICDLLRAIRDSKI